MKIAFWNINTGTGSFIDRRKTLADWSQAMKPDLLLLEEVSSTLIFPKGKEASDAGPYTSLATIFGPDLQEFQIANTLDRNLNPSTKCLVALKRKEWNLVGTAVRPPHDDYGNYDPRRLSLKITGPGVPDVTAMHANASTLGGRTAAIEALRYVRRSRKGLVGGDMNHSLKSRRTDLSAVARPLGWNNKPLAFTQWRKTFVGLLRHDTRLDSLSLTDCKETEKAFRNLQPVPSPHGVIDYLINGDGCQVQSLPNCPHEPMWVRVLKSFDHCPVLYEVAPMQPNGVKP